LFPLPIVHVRFVGIPKRIDSGSSCAFLSLFLCVAWCCREVTNTDARAALGRELTELLKKVDDKATVQMVLGILALCCVSWVNGMCLFF